MKRITALFLLLSCLLASCSSQITMNHSTEEKNEAAESKETTEKSNKDTESEEITETEDYIPIVTDKLSWEKIEAFAKANEAMTIEEAREVCVSFLRFSLTFAWTPDSDFKFSRNKNDEMTTLKKGTVYGGLPYGGVSSGTVYRLMEVYDTETGVVNMKKVAPGGETQYFANQCSMGAYQGWGRVINSPNYTWTEHMTQKNGFLCVGPYTYENTISSFSEKGTAIICEENGEQAMFQSYAAMLPADGLVCNNPHGGHVIMCSGNVKVVYNSDGTINGEESSFTVLDQGQKFTEKTQSNGSKYMVQGGVDRTLTFKKALDSTYIPFTFAEFLGTDPIENAEAKINLTGSAVTQADLRNAVIETNYSIADVYINVLDESGEVVSQKPVRVLTVAERNLSLDDAVKNSMMKSYADGKHRVQIQVRLYTGHLLTVLDAALVG